MRKEIKLWFIILNRLFFTTILYCATVQVHYKTILDKTSDFYTAEPKPSDFLGTYKKENILKFGPASAIGCAYSCRAARPRAYCDGFYHNATNRTCYLLFNQIQLWSPVLRSTEGSRHELYKVWLQNQSINTLPPKSKSWQQKLTDHNMKGVYKSNVVDRLWSAVKRIKMEMFKNKQLVSKAEFNATATTKLSWLNATRLIYSNWTDISTPSVMSVEGYQRIYRTKQRFLMQKAPAVQNCADQTEKAWQMVLDGPTSTGSNSKSCDYENNLTFPVFYYSNQKTNVAKTQSSLSRADVFIISVRYW